ncbi:MAG: ABC transporter permease [Dictyoglomus sp. NZ13-RE01]|nr:MAG: ABC transporter permease [Dictyoglomus sp. NZ13-RE01]
MLQKKFGYILIFPSFLVITLVLFYPLIYSLFLSFYQTSVGLGGLKLKFVGLNNYIDVLRSSEWWMSFLRTAYFVFYDIFVGMSLGLGIAILLNKNFRFRGIARTLVLFPYVLPTIVKALMWKWIYNSDYGFLNSLLYQLGIINHYIPWLSEPKLAIHMLIIVNLWEGTPFAIILYLAALQTIPNELYEAAEIDGANSWQIFSKITLPLLMPINLMLIVYKTIATFKIFDIVYALTGGGPGTTTQVVAHLMYSTVFDSLQFGKGASMSFILLIIILVLVYIYTKLFKSEINY